MALALYETSTPARVVSVLQNKHIHDLIKDNFYEVYKLIMDPSTRKGVIKSLAAAGVFKRAQGQFTIDAKENGDCNFLTWSKYRHTIEEWLEKKVCNLKLLKPAREVIAEYIYDEHYFVYPRWPSLDYDELRAVNKHEKISVDLSGKYDESGVMIMWAAKGKPSVSDVVTRKYPGDDRRYETEVRGDLILQGLFVDKCKLLEYNEAIVSDPNRWKKDCMKWSDDSFAVESITDTFSSLFSGQNSIEF
mmetsp:Transcript_53859/g.66014  ORF Transcript_53859/g.66014 Transcript_53859/m.66014 type:complete len:247 (-) Transcript_53859:160-900(-)